jgi:hypothetical protein
MFRVGSELDPKLFTSRIQIRIRNYFFYPDPKLGGKWDPDPKKIVADPQHCWIEHDLTIIQFSGTGTGN